MYSRKNCNLILKLTAGTVVFSLGVSEAQAHTGHIAPETTPDPSISTASETPPTQNLKTTPNLLTVATESNDKPSTQFGAPDRSQQAVFAPPPEQETPDQPTPIASSAQTALQSDPPNTAAQPPTPTHSSPEPSSISMDPDRAIFLQALGAAPASAPEAVPASALQGTVARNATQTPFISEDQLNPPAPETPSTEPEIFYDDISQAPPEGTVSEEESEEEEQAPPEEDGSSNSSENEEQSLPGNNSPEITENGSPELESGTGGEGLNVNFNFSGSPLESGLGGPMEEPIAPGGEMPYGGTGAETMVPPTGAMPDPGMGTTGSTESMPDPGIGSTAPTEATAPTNPEATQTPPRDRQPQKQKLRKAIRAEMRRDRRRRMRHRQQRESLWGQAENTSSPSNSASPGINNKMDQGIHERVQRRKRKRHRQHRELLWGQTGNTNLPANSASPGINNKMNQGIYKRIRRKPLRRHVRRMRIRPFRRHKMVFRQRPHRFRMRQPGAFRIRHHRPFRMKRGRR